MSPFAVASPLPARERSRSKKRPFSKLRACRTVTSWTNFADVATYTGIVPRSTRTKSPYFHSDVMNPKGSRHNFRACPRSGTAPGARGTGRDPAACGSTAMDSPLLLVVRLHTKVRRGPVLDEHDQQCAGNPLCLHRSRGLIALCARCGQAVADQGRPRSYRRPFSKERAWVVVMSRTRSALVATYIGIVPR